MSKSNKCHLGGKSGKIDTLRKAEMALAEMIAATKSRNMAAVKGKLFARSSETCEPEEPYGCCAIGALKLVCTGEPYTGVNAYVLACDLGVLSAASGNDNTDNYLDAREWIGYDLGAAFYDACRAE